MKNYLLKLISIITLSAMVTTGAAAAELTAKDVAEQTAPKKDSVETTQKESEYNYVDSVRLKMAHTLLGALKQDDLFQGETLTRGEFVNAVVKIMKSNAAEASGSVYQDVNTSYEYAGSIESACALGWISGGDYFRPKDEITISEAVKILVSAAGYGEKADFEGGFPTGYYAEADDLDLLKGIKQTNSETVKPQQARVMLYNLLNAPWSDKTYLHNIHGADWSAASSGKMIIEVFYGLKKIEGIINATAYNSLEYEEGIGSNKELIEIDGKILSYDNVKYDMLGKFATAFYDDETGEIAAIDTNFKNKTVQYDLEDLEFENVNLVKYTDDKNKTHNIKLSGGVMLYNGRTVKEMNAEYFDNDGYATFLDNDDDGKYEVISLTAYTYMEIGNADRYNRIITDEHSGISLDLSKINDDMIDLRTASGAETSFYGLSSNMIIQILMPEDKDFAEIKIIDTQIVGEAESIDDDYITVGGTRYKLSKHFKAYYRDEVSLGNSNTYYLGYDNMVIGCKEISEKFKYGFVTKAFNEEGDSVARMKIFTQAGKFEVYDVDPNVIADGVKTDPLTLENVYVQAGDRYEKRAIRYMLNSANSIIKLDTASEYDANEYEQKLDENNKLRYYPDYKNTLRYRSGNNVFTGSLLLSKAKVFNIPSDLSKTEKYRAGDASTVLANDIDYTPYVFDVDEDGYAGMVIIEGDIISGSENEYIVESVGEGINSDYEVGKIINCWSGGMYYTLYLSEDVQVKKDSGDALVPGDIVRLKTDSENNILNVAVDFDYDSFNISSTVGSWAVMPRHSSPAFWHGIVYSSKDSFVQISNVKDEFGEYDFSRYNLRPISVRTNNIVRFDCETKAIRPISADEIKSYRSANDEAEYIFIRTAYDSPNFVVVFDKHNVR